MTGAPLVAAPVPLAEPFATAATGWNACLRYAEETAPHRREDCAAYAACLNRAGIEGWRGFSCLTCSSYSRELRPFVVTIPLREIRKKGRRERPESLEGWKEAYAAARSSIEAGDDPPILTIAARGRGGGHLGRGQRDLFGRRPWLLAAVDLGVQVAQVVQVERGGCPICSRQEALPGHSPPQLNILAYCRACKGIVVARRDWFHVHPDRDEEARRERDGRQRTRPPLLAAAVIASQLSLCIGGGS